MAKEKLKQDANPVGVNCVHPHFEGIAKKQRGITLIALIITIIVMLILVAVSVTVALNGGLFSTAKGASKATNAERDNELALSEGQIEVDGKKYASYEDYLNKKPIVELPYKTSIEGLAEGVTLIPYNELTGDLKTAAEQEKIIAVLKETIDGTEKIAVVPKGYEVSTTDGEDSISAGLVITDGTNEFVWIPVSSDFTATYSDSSSFSEPTELTFTHSTTTFAYDTQNELNYYYGEGYYDYPETDEEKANVNNDFAYKAHYEEMVASVNKYDGFYIGRYETTIDEEGRIGSKVNTTVLTAGKTLKEGTNPTSNEKYYYRWWGLYAVQRKANVEGNGSTVQTNMIWGQQWDAMLSYFDTLGLDYSATPVATLSTSSYIVNSGQAQYTYNGETINDKIYNIFDLRRNAYDWTAEAGSTSGRVIRGGHFDYSTYSASNRDHNRPIDSFTSCSSRVALYIK